MMIRTTLNQGIKDAMKSKDSDRLYVLKMIKAEFSKVETAKGFNETDFTEAKENSILSKMYKTWDEECQFFKENGRDSSELERRLLILKSFLPEKVDVEKIRQAIIDSGETIEMKSMGKILKSVQVQYPSVTGKEVSDVLKNLMAEK